MMALCDTLTLRIGPLRSSSSGLFIFVFGAKLYMRCHIRDNSLS